MVKPAPKKGARAGALIRAAHIEPTIAVTVLASLLAVATGLGALRLVLVTAAVFAGQLVIGWSNDLLDAGRDSTVGRSDKPLATGEVTRGQVSVALGGAAVVAVALSAALGWRSALVHLVLVVGSGVAYNLGLKATMWSWLPYVVAFGSLPAVVSLAAAPPEPPKAWVVAASAALGAAAHFLNTVPDLADDAATGVRGLPAPAGRPALPARRRRPVDGGHGGHRSRTARGADSRSLVSAAAGCGTGRRRAHRPRSIPFRCGVAIALLNVILLVLTVRR